MVLAGLVIALASVAPAQASSAPDAGSAFRPAPQSQPVFGTKAPAADPARQQHYVIAHDGVDIYVETSLPAPKNGHLPPAHVPTILINTPYSGLGYPNYDSEPRDEIHYFTARGYAVAVADVRGTGRSGGCLEQTGPNQIDDGARVIEYLGRDAPWTDGNVGMYGISYDAETQISVAGRGDPARTKYLKAIVPVAAVGGQYEYANFDGVPIIPEPLASWEFYFFESVESGGAQLPGGPRPSPITLGPDLYAAPNVKRAPERVNRCQVEFAERVPDTSGNMNDYWEAREYRPGAPHVRAATLMVHGIDDFNVRPLTEAGFFDRLPASTPHKGLFGQWNHAFPDDHPAVEPGWDRADWLDMVTAWYDRYLKGLDTGVEQWPGVQVQDNLGQWRAEPDWPFTGGPTAQLALSSGGVLGTARPSGTTKYDELSARNEATTVAALDKRLDSIGHAATFETAPLPAPLRVIGQPLLDLWVKLPAHDAHVSASIEALGPDGQPLPHSIDYGWRSARHLQPLVDGRFDQRRQGTPPVGVPVHIALRFYPTDLAVPTGGRLRLTIAGSMLNTMPSGGIGKDVILHDCSHPSVLRFYLPHPGANLLNVRESDERGPLADAPQASDPGDGGGLAVAPVCGEASRAPIAPGAK